MKPFERCGTDAPDNWKDFLAMCKANGQPFKTREEKKAVISTWRYMERCVHFTNGDYHVAIDYDPPHGFSGLVIWHLAIKRHDRSIVHDWRELQQVKNLLCGEEMEAIELYPAESRVVDTANSYHLFAFAMTDKGDEAPRLPIGWQVGMKTDDPKFGKAKQRPRQEAQP